MCPVTGEIETLIAPYVDKTIMTHHIVQILEKTKTGKCSVVIMGVLGCRSSGMASRFIGGEYQECEYLKAAPVFTGTKPHSVSLELSSPAPSSESTF